MIEFIENDILKAYVGNTEVKKVCLGDELVWSGESSTLLYDSKIEYNLK